MKPHKHAELIKAWADGAQIEFYSKIQDEWLLDFNPSWGEHFQYRIKTEPSEPHYVRFTWEDREQLRGKWVRGKKNDSEECIVGFTKNLIDGVCTGADWYSFVDLFYNFTFLDGSPVGKKV